MSASPMPDAVLPEVLFDRLNELIDEAELSVTAAAIARLVALMGQIEGRDGLEHFFEDRTRVSACKQDLEDLTGVFGDISQLFDVLPARAVSFIAGLRRSLA